MNHFCVYVAILLCLLASCALVAESARGIWGGRRKRDEDREVEVGSTGEASNNKDSDFISPVDEIISKRRRRMVSPASVDVAQNVANLVDAYLKMMDELMVSPQFDEIATPEGFKNMLEQIPGLGDSPEIAAMLSSPEFQDPAVLKQTIKDGLAAIKLYAGHFIELLSDPSKTQELISQLPPDLKVVLEGVLNGDNTALKAMLSSLPGVGATQLEALESLLDTQV